RAFGDPIDQASANDISTGISKDALREAIYAERFKEFAYEGKHWFDLKRTDRLMAVEEITEDQLVYPIPQRELDTNPNMVQNKGYD
ncbi:MAG: RagB/SusD family nutrient uptake outer membrane protein, partial [Cyclobacteriaceae bacterium]|nr:RagB/SusD family nutrient uptake outer membrane protein [Cyclobacteriaceae bacterium SS2]